MKTLHERIQEVRWLVLDVDGVLTNGQITYSDDEREIKSFHVRDGLGLKLWQDAGHELAIITGRKSSIVERRAKELGIRHLYQGIGSKISALQQLRSETGVEPSAMAAMGDDLPELPLFQSVGVRIAVRDACSELRASADLVTELPGGKGAVREAIEWLLKEQGRWSELLKRFRF